VKYILNTLIILTLLVTFSSCTKYSVDVTQMSPADGDEVALIPCYCGTETNCWYSHDELKIARVPLGADIVAPPGSVVEFYYGGVLMDRFEDLYGQLPKQDEPTAYRTSGLLIRDQQISLSNLFEVVVVTPAGHEWSYTTVSNLDLVNQCQSHE
jgi:hypothetical protein